MVFVMEMPGRDALATAALEKGAMAAQGR